MPSTINASTSAGGGIIQTADASGDLALQGAGVTGLTVNANQKTIIASTTLATPSAGMVEYNGTIFTGAPTATTRGIIPNEQFFRLNNNLAGANATGAQSVFGVGVTLAASTVYEFEIFVTLNKTAGTTSHTISWGYGGTATIFNTLLYTLLSQLNANPPTSTTFTPFSPYVYTSTTSTVLTANITSAINTSVFLTKGTVSISAGGTFIPQYTLSVAPGGAYSTLAGSYMKIKPIGVSSANTSVGTWA